MLKLSEHIDQAVAAVRERWPASARAGIILGTGLGSLAGQIQDPVKIDYGSIPHFPRSTAISHAGQLVCGELEGLIVVAR